MYLLTEVVLYKVVRRASANSYNVAGLLGFAVTFRHALGRCVALTLGF